MADPINFIPKRIITTGMGIPEIGKSKINQSNTVNNNQSFADILNNEVSKNDDMKFSAHALKRIQERSISLSDEELREIKQAVSKASDKGIRESLVVMKDIALIVNIPNKTVITAVDGKSIKDNVFTNIDGAVFI